jgi:hypothetical protein
MKKAKIMLLSVAVVAVVGGALAFKANSKFNRAYCYRIDPVAGPCQGGCVNCTAVPGVNWYTLTFNVPNCPMAFCPTQGDLQMN